MTLPIGHLLVRMGVLTERQRVHILEEQRVSNRPFGELAEEMFGVSQAATERAWSEQYATMAPTINPTLEAIDPGALHLVNRRQAWQFRFLPMRYDGDELMVCTTREHLVRALNFATRHVPAMCFFVLAEPESLGEALVRHYPMDGMSPGMVSARGSKALAGEATS